MDSTGQPSDTGASLADADTAVSPGLRPEVLVGPEHEQQRRVIEAALFGGSAEPVSFGRYRLLRRLGQGGMGSVYAAYDDHLDRKIALKLIHASRLDSAEARERTLREARALARLSHPHVVHVYEVGELDGQLFVAMEFLAGPTLRSWLDGQERPWRETLAVLRQAGEGLAAAHAQGIVHRDFKPHNAMFGADGRMRVLDFGLARMGDAEELRTDDLKAAAHAPNDALTQTGTLLGTPAYMAPEQFARQRADARSDQFTFCVALYEALYGHRPFTGETVARLAEAITAGQIVARLKDTRVPQWVHSVLLRGLHTDPDRRWPSMPALLAALERDPRAWARRIGAAALLLTGVGAIAGSVAGYRQWDVAQRTAACEAEGAVLDATWNDDARQHIRDAFAATGVSYAQTAAEKVIPWLTAQADAWRQARTETCLDAQVRGTWDAATADRSRWCLDERRIALEALIAELSQASKMTVQKSVLIGASLSQLAQCRDAPALARLPPLPADRQAARAILELISRADMRMMAGEYKDGLAAAGEALVAAEALGSVALAAAAQLRTGGLLSASGKYTEAEKALENAYFQAIQVGALGVAADATERLTFNVGTLQARHEDGRRWSRHADVVLSALGAGEESLQRAGFLSSLGDLHDAAGAYDEAKAAHRRALAIREEVLGPDHIYVAESLGNLASLYAMTTDFAEAKALFERALAICEEAMGPDHPHVASILSNLANTHTAAGRPEKAKALLTRALAIREATLGPDHPQVATTLNNLAKVAGDMGYYEEAMKLQSRSLAIQEKALGPDHPTVAVYLGNLGTFHGIRGDNDVAKPLLTRALAIREKALGPDHPQITTTLGYLAQIHLNTQAYDEAKLLLTRALVIREKALEPDNLDIADTLGLLATAHTGIGAYDEAMALHERALEILEKRLGPDDDEVAAELHGLAMAHAFSGAYEQAKPLYERALAIREKTAGADDPEVAMVLNNLAGVDEHLGAFAEAKALRTRALAIYEQANPDVPQVASSLTRLAHDLALMNAHEDAKSYRAPAPLPLMNHQHPRLALVAGSLCDLGRLHLDTGDYNEAKRLYERALTIYEETGPDNPGISNPLTGLAEVALAERRPADAVPLVKRSVLLQAGNDPMSIALGNSRFVLAQALWDAPAGKGRDRDRALALARQALETLRSSRTRTMDEVRSNVEAFVKRHRGAP